MSENKPEYERKVLFTSAPLYFHAPSSANSIQPPELEHTELNAIDRPYIAAQTIPLAYPHQAINLLVEHVKNSTVINHFISQLSAPPEPMDYVGSCYGLCEKQISVKDGAPYFTINQQRQNFGQTIPPSVHSIITDAITRLDPNIKLPQQLPTMSILESLRVKIWAWAGYITTAILHMYKMPTTFIPKPLAIVDITVYNIARMIVSTLPPGLKEVVFQVFTKQHHLKTRTDVILQDHNQLNNEKFLIQFSNKIQLPSNILNDIHLCHQTAKQQTSNDNNNNNATNPLLALLNQLSNNNSNIPGTTTTTTTPIGSNNLRSQVAEVNKRIAAILLRSVYNIEQFHINEISRFLQIPVDDVTSVVNYSARMAHEILQNSQGRQLITPFPLIPKIDVRDVFEHMQQLIADQQQQQGNAVAAAAAAHIHGAMQLMTQQQQLGLPTGPNNNNNGAAAAAAAAAVATAAAAAGHHHHHHHHQAAGAMGPVHNNANVRNSRKTRHLALCTVLADAYKSLNAINMQISACESSASTTSTSSGEDTATTTITSLRTFVSVDCSSKEQSAEGALRDLKHVKVFIEMFIKYISAQVEELAQQHTQVQQQVPPPQHPSSASTSSDVKEEGSSTSTTTARVPGIKLEPGSASEDLSMLNSFLLPPGGPDDKSPASSSIISTSSSYAPGSPSSSETMRAVAEAAVAAYLTGAPVYNPLIRRLCHRGKYNTVIDANFFATRANTIKKESIVTECEKIQRLQVHMLDYTDEESVKNAKKRVRDALDKYLSIAKLVPKLTTQNNATGAINIGQQPGNTIQQQHPNMITSTVQVAAAAAAATAAAAAAAAGHHLTHHNNTNTGSAVNLKKLNNPFYVMQEFGKREENMIKLSAMSGDGKNVKEHGGGSGVIIKGGSELMDEMMMMDAAEAHQQDGMVSGLDGSAGGGSGESLLHEETGRRSTRKKRVAKKRASGADDVLYSADMVAGSEFLGRQRRSSRRRAMESREEGVEIAYVGGVGSGGSLDDEDGEDLEENIILYDDGGIVADSAVSGGVRARPKRAKRKGSGVKKVVQNEDKEDTSDGDSKCESREEVDDEEVMQKAQPRPKRIPNRRPLRALYVKKPGSGGN